MRGRLLVVMAVALAPLVATAAPKAKAKVTELGVRPRWETLPLPPAMPAATSTGHVEVKGAQVYDRT